MKGKKRKDKKSKTRQDKRKQGKVQQYGIDADRNGGIRRIGHKEAILTKF